MLKPLMVALALACAACMPQESPPPGPIASPGSTGAICGGIAGFACRSPDDYCAMAEGQCRIPDSAGTCTPKRPMCTREFRPVCGCDGKTYGNACTAQAAGVSIAQDGECAD